MERSRLDQIALLARHVSQIAELIRLDVFAARLPRKRERLLMVRDRARQIAQVVEHLAQVRECSSDFSQITRHARLRQALLIVRRCADQLALIVCDSTQRVQRTHDAQHIFGLPKEGDALLQSRGRMHLIPLGIR